jgi:prepilin-type N-terminal cleavage/methylation domain-containing protein
MLARIRKAMDEREGGFTLIELLVVIIIIGILAAIAIPVFLNQRKKGYEASMKSDLRTVANEMETYFTDNQVYPAASTVTASGQTVTVGTGGNPVTLSSGNAIVVTQAGNNGFCLSATSNKTTKLWQYNSLTGGLTATACPASATGF